MLMDRQLEAFPDFEESFNAYSYWEAARRPSSSGLQHCNSIAVFCEQ